MSNYRRMTDSLPTCMSCGAVLYGAYCSQCGQRGVGPITLRGSLAEAARRVRTMDSRWLRTAAALTVDPGRMIRRFLRGRRIPYVAPPLYALVAVALCVGVVYWQRLDLTAPGTPWSMPDLPVQAAAVAEGGSSAAAEGAPNEGSAEESPGDPGASLARAVFALSTASSLLVAAATALLQTRLFQNHDFTWTETYVFELYVFGHLALHQTLFAILGAFASTVGLAALGVVIVLFLAFSLSGFYRKGLVDSLPAALLLATVQVAGVFVIGSLVRIALRA